jgi:PadR family transcriptional regulator
MTTARPDPSEPVPLTPLSLGILLTVAEGPLHGYAVMKAVEARGGPRLVAGAGSLYAALDRMVEQGLLESTEDEADPRRRRRFALTASGREAARGELRRLAALVQEGREKRLVPEGTA